MLGWRAWYADGTVYSSSETGWNELPLAGVLVVVEYRTTGKTIYNGGDWYYLVDGRFGYVRSGEWGTWKPEPEVPCGSCVKRGEAAEDEEFWRAHGAAWSSSWP